MKIQCWSCGEPRDTLDEFCPQCGAGPAPETKPEIIETFKPNSRLGILNKPKPHRDKHLPKIPPRGAKGIDLVEEEKEKYLKGGKVEVKI